MVLIVVASALFICFVLVLIKLTRHFALPQQLPVTAEWIAELSVERYRPMLRLLNEEEFEFLRTQPGFTPAMATKLRIRRCEIFRGYLHVLDSDFKRICMAVKVLMVQAQQDRPDLASVLVKSQMTFAVTMIQAQAQMMCYRYGFGTVDVTALLKLFDGMRIELWTLFPAELGAGA